MTKTSSGAPSIGARLEVLVRHLNSSPCRAPLAQQAVSSTSQTINRRVVLKSVPDGEPKPSDFELVTNEIPTIADGQMLLRTEWLSLDPYMRTGEGMKAPGAVGRTLIGGTVSEVLESKVPGWTPGDRVVGYYGWQEYAVGTPNDVQWGIKHWPIEKWDPSLGEASTALGTLGMTGYTAYLGLLKVAQPKSGETVVVSAASGAVGSVVGQIAKIKGCRVVGIAGGPKKCMYCVNDLGFDACVDYKKDDFPQALAAAVPEGVDVYFENVGGDVLEAVIPLLNKGCRVPICGFISQYNSANGRTSQKHPKTPLQRLKEVGLPVLGKNGSTSGYTFFGFMQFVPDFPDVLRDLSQWVKEGKLKVHESVTHGLDSSIDAFIGMLRGENFGKTLVKISSDSPSTIPQRSRL